MVHKLQFPLKPSGCMAHITGLTCPQNLTGHLYLGVGLLPKGYVVLHFIMLLQGSALLAKRPSKKTSSYKFYSKEPSRLSNKQRQADFLTQMSGQLKKTISHNLKSRYNKQCSHSLKTKSHKLFP